MKVLLAVLYLALCGGASHAQGVDPAALEAMRAGDMRKLVVHAAPQPASDAVVLDEAGGEHRLADHAGKIVVLNFWATWCAPCRHEMPSLDAVQQALGGEDFAVVPVATGRNAVDGIRRFFDEVDVRALPILIDQNQAMARDMAVLGLPITVILDREGREIARVPGDADWNGPAARAILTALIDG